MLHVRTLCWTLLALMSLPAVAEDPDALRRTLQNQLLAGRYADALDTARRCSEAVPGNAAVWYNLAGLESQFGSAVASVAAFEHAVTLGFDDFRHAAADTDLGHVRTTTTFERLRVAWADGLAVRRRERALTLPAATWSDSIDLPDRIGGLTAPQATLRLRADADGLEVDVLLGDAELPPIAPWQPGGAGIFAAVVLPSDPATGEGDVAFDFGFGWQNHLPAGAVRIGERWQLLAELSPKMRLDHDTNRLRLTCRIPWNACGTLHPLIDRPLGINVVYVRPGTDGVESAAWIGDPGLGRAQRAWRRSIPVTVTWRRQTQPVVIARLADRVDTGDTATLAPLAAVVQTAAPAEVHLVVRDRHGTMIHDSRHGLAGTAGLRQDTVRIALPTAAGSARIGASIGVGGRRALASWETTVAVVPADWRQRTTNRIVAAPSEEQPSLQLRFDAILATLANRQPREDAAALAATVDELEELLARIDKHGTSMPAGGPFLAVSPGSDLVPPIRCDLALPRGWRPGQPVRVVAVLARAPGAERRAVERAPVLLAERAEPGDAPAIVLAVPHLSINHDPARARATVEHVVSWLREFLRCDTVHLVGVDLLAATVLEVAASNPQDLAGILMVTGVNFVPYPHSTATDLAARFATIPRGLPAGWIWFPDEQRPGDQAAILRQVLMTHGLDLRPDSPVPGGLGFDQAWTRALAWALSF